MNWGSSNKQLILNLAYILIIHHYNIIHYMLYIYHQLYHQHYNKLKMQLFQHVVYFSTEEAVPSATHKKINTEKVELSKSVTYLRSYRVGEV